MFTGSLWAVVHHLTSFRVEWKLQKLKVSFSWLLFGEPGMNED